LNSQKIVVSNLAESTTDNVLKEYFSKYGEVKYGSVKMVDGKSKCFAAVIFSDSVNHTKAMEDKDHEIESTPVKLTEVGPSEESVKTNKLFVGGLPAELHEKELSEYFSKFGTILNFQFVQNRMNGLRKPFCFILFDDTEAVEKITLGKIPPNSVVHTIEGLTVDCKKKFDESHPIQQKIKARSQAYKQNYSNNSGPPSQYPQYDPSQQNYSGYPGYYPGYEGYYAGYYGYPGYGYPAYPGYGYPGYSYPQAGYGASSYGPVKPSSRSQSGHQKPY
jgi:RNA recognition motif-containing protein